MLRVVFIFIVFFVFVCFQSKAQVLSKQDSIQYKIELRRITDSTRIALKTILLKKRQDSLAQTIKIRQIERKKIADSLRVAKKKQRDALKKQNKDFTARKKERERIRDSVQQASERAALARKAYKKSLKTQLKKDQLKKEAKAKSDQLKQEKEAKRQKELIARKEKKLKEEKAEQKKKDQEAKIAKAKEDSKKERKLKEEKNKSDKKKKDEKATVVKTEKDSKEKVSESAKTQKKKEDTKKKQEKIIAKQNEYNKLDSLHLNSTKKENRVSNSSPLTTEVPVHFKYGKINRSIEPPLKKESFFAFQIGSSNYLGDLGGNSNLQSSLLGDLSFKDNNFFYGFSFTQMRREAIGIRLSYVFGEISGSDKNTYFTKPSDPAYLRFIRNLDFKTKINEGSLMFELHPFKFLSYKKKLHNSFLQPYGLIGIGRFSFNPQGSYFDTDVDALFWYDLQPLSLEGQGMSEFPDREPYALTQWNVPYGLGFKYEISPTISLGLEYVGRLLFTDYLDDVSTKFIDPDLFSNYFNAEDAALATNLSNKSKLIDAGRAFKPGQQRGNPENNDFYFSFSARLIIKISKNKNRLSILKPVYKYDDSEICE